MSVHDPRTAPFIWASIAALAHLRREWDTSPEGAGVRESVGRSVYYALCELANEDRARPHVNESSGEFRTSRKRICDQSGVSDKPVDKALREMERIGLVHVERSESSGDRPGVASSYTLLEPDQTYGASPHVDKPQRTELVRTTYGASPHVDAKGAEQLRTSLYRQEVKERKKKGERAIVESEKATKSWNEAKGRLVRQLGRPTYTRFIAGLEVAGEREGRIVLVDTTEHGGGSWIDERLRPLAMEVLEGFDGIEVLDERQLADEGGVVEPPTPVEQVFFAWRESTGKTSRTQLNRDRRKVIEKAFAFQEEFTTEELIAAVRGWRHSSHHRGENEQRTPYNSLKVLLRDADQIEKFRDLELAHRARRDGKGKGRRAVGDPALAAITGRPA